MVFHVDFTETAIADLHEAVSYYNAKSPGLGLRMFRQVEGVIEKILLLPEAYSIRYENVRACSAKGFPYLVFYSLEYTTKKITVLRIFNTWKNPVFNKE